MTDQSLSGNWTGRYDYAGTSTPGPVSFDAILTETGATLRGEIIEPNTFRPEATDTLMAVISGLRSGGRVSFVKIYTDFEQGRPPHYEGRINGTATRITGRWFFPDTPHIFGSFLMARTQRAAVRRPAEAAATIDG